MKKYRKTYIEIINTCDGSCAFCPGTSRASGALTRDTFAYVLNQIIPFSKYISFHVVGEPLLHPELGMFLDMCVPYDFRVNLVTNGLTIQNHSADLLGKPALRRLSISLQSGFSLGSPEAFQAYLDSVAQFALQAKPDTHLALVLRLWQSRNEDSLSPEAKELQLSRYHQIEDTFEIPFALDNMPETHHSVYLRDNLVLGLAPEFEWPELANEVVGDTGFCYGLDNQYAILVDGTVVPCCLDRNGVMSLGNIFEVPLADILNSPRASAIRRGFKTGCIAEELCRKCSYRLRFSGI